MSQTWLWLCFGSSACCIEVTSLNWFVAWVLCTTCVQGSKWGACWGSITPHQQPQLSPDKWAVGPWGWKQIMPPPRHVWLQRNSFPELLVHRSPDLFLCKNALSLFYKRCLPGHFLAHPAVIPSAFCLVWMWSVNTKVLAVSRPSVPCEKLEIPSALPFCLLLFLFTTHHNTLEETGVHCRGFEYGAPSHVRVTASSAS